MIALRVSYTTLPDSWKWPLIQVAGLTALAYVITLIAYQVGSLVIRLS